MTDAYKVGFIIASLNRGGTETKLLDTLQRLDRNRFDPFLFVAKGGGELLAEACDQRVYVGLPAGGNSLRSLYALWKTLRRERPDAVWCLQGGVTGFAGRLFARLLRVPIIILSLHGRQSERQPALDWPNRLLTPFTTQRVVAVSNEYRQQLIAEGIAESLISVLYNGVDTARFSPHRSPSGRGGENSFKRAILGIEPSHPVIGTVGNLLPVKAHEVLLKAAGRVIVQCPDALFVLVGEGERRAALERLAQALGVSQNVRFLGRQRDVSDVMRAFDLFALTSNSEGCPNVILEAMASELPVVSTRVGGVPELVDDEVSILVPPQDDVALAQAILQLLTDPARRQAMGEAARRRAVERFSIEAMIRAREALLMELLVKYRA